MTTDQPNVDTSKADTETKVHHPSAEERVQEIVDAFYGTGEEKESAKEDDLTDSKKIDLLGNLAVIHAENQVELHRHMLHLQREFEKITGSLAKGLENLHHDMDGMRGDVQEELRQLNAGINDYLDEAESAVKANEFTDEEEEAEYESTAYRAYAFLIRCVGVGLLIWLIAVAIVKVFPEGV